MTERAPMGIPILTYHRIVPDVFDPAVECYRLLHLAVSQDAFEKQLTYVRSKHTVIGLRALVSALTAAEPLPPNACVITLDDSYSDHFKYAFPVLASLGLTATFFIESGHTAESGQARALDRYFYLLDHSPCASFDLALSDGSRLGVHSLDLFSKMTLLQNNGLKRWLKEHDPVAQDALLRELEGALDVQLDVAALGKQLYLSTAEMEELVRGGMELGAHTIHHPSLLHVDVATARQEIFESGDFVKRIAGQDDVAFAYPYGDASNSPAIRRLVRDYGYYAACSTRAGLNLPETNRFELKRVEMTQSSL